VTTRLDAIRAALDTNGMAFGFNGDLRKNIIDEWAKTIEGEIVAAEATNIGEVSDGFHTFNELYEYRMLYNAHAVKAWTNVVKSLRHHDGELCFGGGWFIVTAQLPTGQVSNHYRVEHWDLFDVPEVETAPEWDGHSPAQAAQRLREAL